MGSVQKKVLWFTGALVAIVFLRPFEAGMSTAPYALGHSSTSIAYGAMVSTIVTVGVVLLISKATVLSVIGRQDASDTGYKRAAVLMLAGMPVHITVGLALLNDSSSLFAW